MKYTKAIVTILVGVFMSIHFAIIAFYHLPDNPIKHQFKFSILNYINPFFTQEWKLFAPNPVSSNMSLSYQFTYFKNGNIIGASPILDVNKPIVDHKRDHFFSIDLRLLKFFSASCLNVMETRQEVAKDFFSESNTKLDSAKFKKVINSVIAQSFGDRAIKEYALFVLRNYERNMHPGYDSIRVIYQINNAIFPRFSKRYQNYYDTKNYKYTTFISKPYFLYKNANGLP